MPNCLASSLHPSLLQEEEYLARGGSDVNQKEL